MGSWRLAPALSSLGAYRAEERSRRLTYTSLGPGQERHADVTCDMTII
jgi:hypothetical protein